VGGHGDAARWARPPERKPFLVQATSRRRLTRATASVLAVPVVAGLGLVASPIGVVLVPTGVAAAEPARVDPATDQIPGSATAALAALGTGGSGEASTRLWLAALVAERSSAEPAELDAIWAKTSPQRLRAVYSALTQVGVPYRSLAMSPGEGFDCSGLTSWAWAQAGLDIPHQSKRQINGASARSPETLLPGDLVYNPGHVVMYLGHAQAIVEAPHSGRLVRVVDWKRKGTLLFGSPLGDEPAPAAPVAAPAPAAPAPAPAPDATATLSTRRWGS
jgi:peptidoglycan DL-endopeptidase CwlO